MCRRVPVGILGLQCSVRKGRGRPQLSSKNSVRPSPTHRRRPSSLPIRGARQAAHMCGRPVCTLARPFTVTTATGHVSSIHLPTIKPRHSIGSPAELHLISWVGELKWDPPKFPEVGEWAPNPAYIPPYQRRVIIAFSP